MRTIYDEYMREANALKRYMNSLKLRRRASRDVGEIKNLEKRIEVLYSEYLELIRDARDILSYIEAVTKC